MDYKDKSSMRRSVRDLDRKYFGGILSKILGSRKETISETPLTPEERKAIQESIVRQVHQPLPDEHSLKRVEIIVLNFKAPEVEVECAKHIIENTKWPYKLNMYDNRPGTKNMSKIWNKLIRESTCDYVLILDSDAFVPKLDPCWLTRMMETFDQKSDCLAVSSKITRTSCTQQLASVAENRGPEKLAEVFTNTCMLYKKEAFEKVGWFDEDFLIYGSDSEWAFRCLKSGSAYVRPDVVVDHVSHYSAQKESRENKKNYNKKIEEEYTQTLYEKKTAI